ncbi:MAG: ATP-binding cassette domain-containing protein [Anaerococcus sp.]|nr:ATP-binding cassette domain-containing protein [Anaerococcus sp.]
MKIRASNITKSFGKNLVLDDVSFDLAKGKISGIVGRNGSGKTTLFKSMTGIYDMDKGDFSIDGVSLKDNRSLISKLAFLPDRFDYFNYYKARKIPDFYRLTYKDFDQDFFFSQLNKNKIDPNQNIRNFSKGIKNILGLITILATRADILFIDEILDGMDIINNRKIISFLLDAKDEGRAILASSHQLDRLAGICDNIFYLTLDGKLVDTADRKVNKLKKVQVVFRDEIALDFLESAILINKLGRVATVLIDMDDQRLSSFLDRDDVVQYDLLSPKIEDYFYMEAGGLSDE